MPTLPDGIFLVDKPVGISSFDVIRRLRKKFNVKTNIRDIKPKFGHAGTLDPLASGLMIIAEGKATKLLSQYLKLAKTYEAEVCLGESTTTGDREGEVTMRKEVGDMSNELIWTTLAGMVGTLELKVPVYSAIKRGGEPLFRKARRGEAVEAPVKKMEIFGAQFVSVSEHDGKTFVTVIFDVGSGTYIRSLAVELGRRLGYPARLENLRRTKVGEWCVEDAVAI